MKNYFLETVIISGKLKVRPLPGQTFESGEAVNPSLFVSCSTSVRETLKAGAKLITSNLNKVKSGKYYTSKSIKLMDTYVGDDYDYYYYFLQ